MAALGALAAGAAHEINNPLAYVITNLSLAVELVRNLGAAQAQRDELLELVEEALEGATRVRATVRGLKAFSRVDEERRAAVDLHAVLETAVKLTSHELRQRAQLVRELGDLPLVEADEPRLVQAFVNLLMNAAHAIPEGAAERHRVRLVTRHEAGRAIVEVHDTGSGIDPAHLPHIFEPFFTTKPAGLGTGSGSRSSRTGGRRCASCSRGSGSTSSCATS